jgi:hypothetical protein
MTYPLAGIAASIGGHLTAIDISDGMLRQVGDLPGVVLRHESWETHLDGRRKYDVIVARMVLRHQVAHTISSVLRTWTDSVADGGSVVVIEGPPPSREKAVEQFYADVMAMKHLEEPRHLLHAAAIADSFLDLDLEAITCERFTGGNSLNQWMDASGVLEADMKSRIFDYHLNAPAEVAQSYRMSVYNNDVVMRWRHAVVIGRKMDRIS